MSKKHYHAIDVTAEVTFTVIVEADTNDLDYETTNEFVECLTPDDWFSRFGADPPTLDVNTRFVPAKLAKGKAEIAFRDGRFIAL